MRNLLTSAFTALALASASAGAQTLTIGATGFDDFGPLNGDFPTRIGQSFVATGGVLQSFSFQLRNDAMDGNTFTYVARLAEWNGSAIGATLFTSGPFTSTTSPTFVLAPVQGVNAAVTVGSQYVAFLEYVAPTTPGVTTSNAVAVYASGSEYAAGELVIGDAGGVFAVSEYDANFQASFATVPEPSTYLLMATGLSALGLVARRRRAR